MLTVEEKVGKLSAKMSVPLILIHHVSNRHFDSCTEHHANDIEYLEGRSNE